MIQSDCGNISVQEDTANPRPQCQFYVKRKKRYCRLIVRPGRTHCSEHEPAPPEDSEDRRVPCPRDPKHTCYVSKLEKHLLVCNAREVEPPPYISRDINAPSPSSEPEPARLPLCQVPKETLDEVIHKINKLYEYVEAEGIEEWKEPSVHSAVAEELGRADRAETSRRHLRQVSSLLNLLQAEGLMQEDTCFVDLGGGSGHLSYFLSSACPPHCRVLLVDRAASRHKRERTAPGPRPLRLRADLADLALERVEHARGPLVAVGKHLCGAGADRALRALCRAPVVGQVRGLALAACCHHRCGPIGAEVAGAARLGLEGPALRTAVGAASWATGGADPRRAETGRRAKAVLDWARVLYLREAGFSARLLRYVPAYVTPENLCIVATKPYVPTSGN